MLATEEMQAIGRLASTQQPVILLLLQAQKTWFHPNPRISVRTQSFLKTL